MNVKPFISKVSLVALALLFALAWVPNAARADSTMTSSDFTNAVRRLWEDHITWTRLYIVSAAAGLPDTDLTAKRLLQNQTDIGNAIKPYYGEEAGNQLTKLLNEHIVVAGDVLAAAKAGDTAKFDAAKTQWYANGEAIAAFLSSANPQSFPLDAMKAEMKMHLDLTLSEAAAQLQGDYAKSIADYDQIHKHILGLADALSSGIMKQFPDKFTTGAAPQVDAHNKAMRQLWEDHITWTRLYIVSAAAGLPDTDLTAKRLLQNQTDIGNAIKPYYGEEAGNQLTKLLNEHILGAADVLAAAKAGDTAKFDAASAKWYDNGNDIANFISGANPTNWPSSALQSEMKMHLDLTLSEAAAQLKGDYAKSIADYDQIHGHILGLADTLSGGIVAQFPAQFNNATPLPTTGMDHTDGSVWVALAAGALVFLTGLVILKRNVQAS